MWTEDRLNLHWDVPGGLGGPGADPGGSGAVVWTYGRVDTVEAYQIAYTAIRSYTMNHLRTRIRQWAEARRTRHITLEQARLRVARGAAYLDDVDPGWYVRIDPATLELADGACCVLGQLHGDFRLGLSRASILHMSSAPRANLSPVRLGLLCVQGVSAAWQAQDYRYLDQAWQEEMARRRPRPRTPLAGPRRAALALLER